MQIPKGWKLVPEYPTQEMCEAAKYGIDARLSVFKWCDGYKAMLANAPECADLAAAQEEAARLRVALEQARSYGSDSWATWLISEVDDALDTK